MIQPYSVTLKGLRFVNLQISVQFTLRGFKSYVSGPDLAEKICTILIYNYRPTLNGSKDMDVRLSLKTMVYGFGLKRPNELYRSKMIVDKLINLNLIKMRVYSLE